MKRKLNPRTLVAIGLMVVCALLVARLIRVTARVGAGPRSLPLAPARATSAHPATPAHKTPAGMGSYDPNLHLAALKSLNARPRPQLERDPFEFEPTPAEVQARNAAEAKATGPPPPPPLPPVPLKAVGFDQDGQGKYRACLVDEQEGTFIVHEGEEFGKRFRVLRITPVMVEIQDETYHQTVQLPFPQ